MGHGMWLLKTIASGAAGFAAVAVATCFPGTSNRVHAPSHARLYTAVDTVRSLAVDNDGTIWAATAGGVVAWNRGGTAERIWTTADGLKANDVERVDFDGAIHVATSAGMCRIDPAGHVTEAPSVLSPKAAEIESEAILSAVDFEGVRYVSTAVGLYRFKDGKPVEIPLPRQSNGSHVSALCVNAGRLVAALYGDGLWSIARGRWSRVPGVPVECGDTTALARSGERLVAGSGSSGVWLLEKGRWSRLSAGGLAVPSPDIEGLATFDHDTWASTFDHGLLRIADDGHVTTVSKPDGLSSNCPRAMAVFGDRLFVRHASGALDAFDGQAWSRAFGHELPRSYVSAIDASSKRLLIGGWGGWAAFDGSSWAYHYDEPELKGRVVTSICDAGDAVWIGTQNAGLLAYREGKYSRCQELQGLGDDWVTSIAASGGRVLVGTYTGGLFEVDGDRVRSVLKVDNFAMRCVSFDRSSGDVAYVATPQGVYVEKSRGIWSRMPSTLSGGLESQAVLSTPAGLWVGSHAALAFVPRTSLSAMATASR